MVEVLYFFIYCLYYISHTFVAPTPSFFKATPFNLVRLPDAESTLKLTSLKVAELSQKKNPRF